MIREAMILAAGCGRRLGELAQNRPKGFVEVGGVSLIERSVAKLLDAGVERIVIGTGYAAEHYERLASRHRQICCLRVADYQTTGSMTTLYALRNEVQGDTLLLESDILYDRRGLAALLGAAHPNVILASNATGSGDEVFLETTADGKLANMSKDPSRLRSIDGELVGITRLSRTAVDALCEIAARLLPHRPRLDYEDCLVAATPVLDLRVLRIDGFSWCEVDTADHLRRAETLVLQRILEAERSEPS